MTRKWLLLAATGLFSGALLAPIVGCEGGGGSSEKPTIDLTTKPKMPSAPSSHKLEPMTPKDIKKK